MKIKIPTGIIKIIIGAALAITSTTAFSVIITAGTSSATLMEDFSALGSGALSSYNGNGVSVAETFVGLSVVDPGGSGFETYSGAPTNPLSLAAGAATTGIFNILNTSAGLAGGTGNGDIGEGVVAMLFDFDIVELGMNIFGNNGGTTLISFYSSAGALVDTISTTLANDLTFTSAVAFRGSSDLKYGRWWSGLRRSAV